MTILAAILEHKRKEIATRKVSRPFESLDLNRAPTGPVRNFRSALRDASLPAPRVIAEVKRRSPSKGPLRADLDAAQISSTYEHNGAAALSVLTDGKYFGGALSDLTAARAAVLLPVLCKDFIIDAYQIYEAFSAGADAILLIAAVLDAQRLREYREVASSLGMDALVEVHDRIDLEAALKSGAEIIGINNRDLRTFEVSLQRTRTLRPLIPAHIVTVSESGIHSLADRESMAEVGVDALLIGERLITAPDIGAVTRELCGLNLALREEVLR